MWSDTKPIGTTTTAGLPLRARSSRWSLTSGSSQGMCGAPDRGAVDEVVGVPVAGLQPHALHDLGRHRPVLADVGVPAGPGALVHRLRDRVGDEDQLRVVALDVAQVRERGQGRVDHGVDEARVVEVVPELVQPRRALHLGDRGEEVLAVLPAAGVRRVRRGHEAGRPGDAVRGHLRERVLQVGVPVAVAPVDRQVDAVAGEVLAQRGEELAVLVVDRRAAPEEEVVLAHLLQPLARDAAAAGDVLQERHHVLGLLRSPEGHQQQRVVRRGIGMHGPILGSQPQASFR